MADPRGGPDARQYPPTGTELQRCPTCDGYGVVLWWSFHVTTNSSEGEACPACQGKGYVFIKY